MDLQGIWGGRQQNKTGCEPDSSIEQGIYPKKNAGDAHEGSWNEGGPVLMSKGVYAITRLKRILMTGPGEYGPRAGADAAKLSIKKDIRKLEAYLMQLAASTKKYLALHRLVRLRRRYIMTRENKLRLRYMMALMFAGMFTLSYVVSMAMPGAESEAEAYALARAAQEQADGPDVVAVAENDESAGNIVSAHISNGIRMASLAIQKPLKPRFKEVEIKSGQTVAGLLQNAGVTGKEAYRAVQALEEYLDVRKVRSGQKIGLHFEPLDDGSVKLDKMEVKLNPVKLISITRSGPEDFESAIREKPLVQRTYARRAEIQTSLYGSAALANIPQAVIAELIRIYSWDVDFQRDIRRGDKLEILYEVHETEDGDFARYGDILYASLSVNGQDVPIYRHEMKDGSVDYFQPNGMSIRKTLMKTPIDGARISSGFGMRHHPVLGYNKMHKGMDFAAPTGTPIYAAGDGVVDYAGRRGGYGNYIRLRHNSKLKTAYAHLHKIKSGVRNGTRVKQGDVIGYVGTTGRSTGPHLHYEVLLNNVQVNPRSVDLPTGEQLTGPELARFKSMKDNMYQQYVSLSRDLEVAFARPSEDEDDSQHGG